MNGHPWVHVVVAAVPQFETCACMQCNDVLVMLRTEDSKASCQCH